MSAADALLDHLPRVTLILGKGGVGKTTCAAALATRAARRGEQTLVLTTDPARALPDVLGAPVKSEATPIPHSPGLDARVLDVASLRQAFLSRWGETLKVILDRGTYLDDDDIAPLVETALPGGDEIFAALELARLLGDGRQYERMFIDTAPTGHTLRLLELPRTFRALIRLLDSMQDKHRFMVRALTRANRPDEADSFLSEMAALAAGLEGALRDASRCTSVLVANGEQLVVDETRRYLAALAELGVGVAAIIWNGGNGIPAEPAFARIRQYRVPRLSGTRQPLGADGLHRWTEAMEPIPARPRARTRTPARRSPPPSPATARLSTPDERRALLRPLTIVAGKGGVGKTTVACALALESARHARTLVVSTDPAPSLADVLATAIPDADTMVPATNVSADRLYARQMDATAAFARLREDYAARVDALFDSLVVGRGVDLAADRAIARDLLALAPPGVDEIYALALLAEAASGSRYDTIIVDPAPTGHLLRLLEMPALALSWTHQIMRLMLKYRDVAGLGETARELLDFSRQLRAMGARLGDSSASGVVLVSLDEPVVRAETARLLAEVSRRGVAVTGIVLNRANAGAHEPSVPEFAAHFDAPVADPPPVGLDAIAAWSAEWRIHQFGK